MRPILLYGPTASGKSALALALARRLGGCVINADALQVFHDWRVLTARPSPREAAQAPHLLYGHVPADRRYSAGEWLREARGALDLCAARSWRPIVAGGTGLYFKVLTEGLADAPPTRPETRAAAEAALARLGLSGLSAQLARRDPETAARIDLANPMRVMRAWEALETGPGLAALWARTPPPLLPLSRCLPLRLDPPREALRARIDARFDAMLAEGALQEAGAALRLPPDAPGLKALGARELVAHLRGALSLEEAAARAKQATRTYAKRQLTWGRNRMRDWRALSLHDMSPEAVAAKLSSEEAASGA